MCTYITENASLLFVTIHKYTSFCFLFFFFESHTVFTLSRGHSIQNIDLDQTAPKSTLIRSEAALFLFSFLLSSFFFVTEHF